MTLADPTISESQALDEWSVGAEFFFLSELFFVLSTTLVRVACALTLLRVIPRHSNSSPSVIPTRVLRWAILVSVSVTTLYSAALFLTSLFQCQPVSFFWEYMMPGAEGKCLNGGTLSTPYLTMSVLYAVHGALSAACDWILGIVPSFMLWHLQMRWRKKALVCILLGLGIVAGTLALVRTIV